MALPQRSRQPRTTPSGAIGNDRNRTPVAWKMALPIAGATATMAVGRGIETAKSARQQLF